MRTAVVLVLAVLLLASCTTPAAGQYPDPTASAPQSLAPGSIVATGSFEGSNSVRGDVVIRIGERQLYSVEVSGFAAPAAAYETVLVPRAVDPAGDCFDTGFRVGLQISEEQPDAVVGDLGTITVGGGGDPTFLRALVLVEMVDLATEADCVRPVIAAAPLTWDFPDLHPDLEVRDLGEMDGARGDVIDAGSTYIVAAGDALSAVAERFDLTEEELLFLNPTRLPSEPGALYADERLNLDEAAR